jgi:hypothetical protein
MLKPASAMTAHFSIFPRKNAGNQHRHPGGGQPFLPDIDPADLAYKALAVNVSDLAAMGADPAWLTLALTLPERMKPGWKRSAMPVCAAQLLRYAADWR